MFTHQVLIDLASAAALAALMAYAVFGGADFGGGIWTLLAYGPRRREQRRAIELAMGPVWEANHVWLIFAIVLLFTCFPAGYAAMSIALFVPLHLALVGIMLRGAAFVFRSHLKIPGREVADSAAASGWGTAFGVTSVITPMLLGASFGVVTEGGIRVSAGGGVAPMEFPNWLSPYSVGCALLALSACAYLAAVYLTVETDGDLREDFRLRAILSGTSTAFLAGLVLLFAWHEANWFFEQLVSLRSSPVLAAGVACFAASAWAIFTRRYRFGRIFAAGEIVLLLLGWGLAQRPYFIYPDMTFQRAAAPAPTIAFMLATLPVGAALLVPSLWLLFRVFKRA
jgi:cytochrome bd ubiquinol oxidase subunit II